MKLWMDSVSGRLNKAERGVFIGAFDTGDQLLAIYTDGSYEIMDIDLELTKKFDPKELFYVGKYDKDNVISAVYYEGERKWTMVKRFQIETVKDNQRYNFITEHKQSKLLFASVEAEPKVPYSIRTKEGKEDKDVALAEFIDVKGWKSLGNKLEDVKITVAKAATKLKAKKEPVKAKKKGAKADKKLKAGDSIEFDVNNGQTEMF
jgi:topoisomerase-4 subunit A